MLGTLLPKGFGYFAIVGFVLMYKGLIKQGTIVSSLDQSEIDEIADEKLDWNSLYWT